MTAAKTPGSGFLCPADCKSDPSSFLGRYLHLCDRTSGLLDEYDADFRHCRCFHPTLEVLALQDAINVRLDAHRNSER